MTALSQRGRPTESFRDRVDMAVSLFVPRDRASEDHKVGEGWMGGERVRSWWWWGHQEGQLVRWEGQKGEVAKQAVESLSLEMFNNRGGSCHCWLGCGSV